MDPLQLWAGVRFAAQNGNTGGLLTAAAQNGLHLSAITAQPGGFCARCAAWRYPELSRLARRYRVRLRIQKRDGLFFQLRPLLRRRGLWAGLFLFLPLLLWLQGAVWATDFTTLTPGQRARAEVILRQQALSAGEFVSEEKLTAGEYALLQSGEFSWASLNFSKGRLIVEAAAAKPVPDIASGTLHGITARVAGTVLETNLTSGTMLVTPGQAVEAGQGLIGTARMERDGTLIFQPAAGRVLAQFEWEFSETLPTTVAADQLTGSKSHQYQLHFAGKSLAFPPWSSHQEDARAITRHLHPAFWGLALPLLRGGNGILPYPKRNTFLHGRPAARLSPAAQPSGAIRCLPGRGFPHPERRFFRRGRPVPLPGLLHHSGRHLPGKHENGRGLKLPLPFSSISLLF